MLANSRSRTVVSRIRRRLGLRMREAFTFLVATAWSELFNDIFRIVAGNDTHILLRLLHAFFFTLLAVSVTILFEWDDEKDED